MPELNYFWETRNEIGISMTPSILIAKDPTTFISKVAAKLEVDPKTCRTAVHHGWLLDLKSYTSTSRHLFTECTKARRLERGKNALKYSVHQESWVNCFFWQENLHSVRSFEPPKRSVSRRINSWYQRYLQDQTSC